MNPISEPVTGITLGWVPILLLWLPFSVWLLRKINLSLKPGPRKWTVLGMLGLVMVAIPVGDDLYIQWRFNRLCRDAGMHFEKKIAVDGFLDETATGPGLAGPVTDPQMIESREQSGFRFLERRAGYVPGNYGTQPTRYSHVEKIHGAWEVSILDQPTARYHYKATSRHERTAFRISKYEDVILDAQFDRVVGRRTIYTRYAGWLDGLWLSYFDARGKQCPPPGKQGDLLTTVLIPINKK